MCVCFLDRYDTELDLLVWLRLWTSRKSKQTILWSFLFVFFKPMLADVVSLEFEGEEVSRTLLSILADFNNVTVSSEATKND